MRLGSSHALAWLPLMGSLAPLVHAADVVYVTDLSIYTLLVSAKTKTGALDHERQMVDDR